jgi:hypothetical protein
LAMRAAKSSSRFRFQMAKKRILSRRGKSGLSLWRRTRRLN